LNARLVFATGFALVHALDDFLFRTGRQTWHGIVFVQQGDLVVKIVLLLDHAL
jgi:hypothetical protein